MTRQMYKGIFWYNPITAKLIVKKVACNRNGVIREKNKYDSSMDDIFNLQKEWAKLSPSVTNGHPYNFFPRGRVEIKNNKAKVTLSPILVFTEPNKVEPRIPLRLIEKEFGLWLKTIRVEVVHDDSERYQYLTDYYLINFPEHK